MPISWYPRNFTNPDIETHLDQFRIMDDSIYAVQLGLYVIAYREYKDDNVLNENHFKSQRFQNF